MLLPTGQPLISTSIRTLFAGSGKQTSFRWRTDTGIAIDWRITLHDRLPVALVSASLGNLTGQAIRLKSIGLLTAPRLACAGHPSQWHLSTLGDTARAGNLAETLPSLNQQTIERWEGYKMPIPFELPTDEFHTDGTWRCFRDFLTLYSDAGKRGLTIAAVGDPVSFVDLRCKCDPGTLRLEASAEMNDILIPPGQWRDAQEIAIFAMPYAEALDLTMRWLASTHGSRTAKQPPVGWCSWYSKYDKITAEDVLLVADAAAKERVRIPLDCIQIDDGFQKTVGDWSLKDTFSCGWKPIIERIKAAGSTPGIWLAPLAVHESTDIFKSHPDWFQRDAKGEFAGEAGNWGPRARWLDPTQPAARQFLRQLIRSCRAEGFEYFKIDFNTLSDNARFHDNSLTRLQAYRSLYALYREEIGEAGYLLSCSGFTRGTIGFADGSRIGPDSNAMWYAPHPCCLAACFKAVGSTSFSNRILYTNDPDVTYLGTTWALTIDEWRSWHSYVGILGGLTMISDLIDKSPAAERLRAFEILTPPAPEPGRSLRGGIDPEHCELGFVARRPWGTSATLTAYNPTALPRDWALDLCLLPGLPTEGPFFAWSFWDETCWKFDGPALHVHAMPTHGCSVLRISPVPPGNEPVFIGSTLHISCGAAELADFRSTEGLVELVLSDAGAREGAIFIAYQGTLALQSLTGMELDALQQTSPGIWRLAIKNRQRKHAQIIKLSSRHS